MLRTGWVGVVVLAGCYSPHVTPGVACVTACPGEQVCVDGFCRDPGDIGDGSIVVDARIDGSPDVDTDGDGSFDNIDNCIDIANRDQHDEDHDDFGDACDPCPHVAIGGTADADADTVGDACDPQPSVAKQRWAYFDPFTSRRMEWGQTSQAIFANDQMRLNGDIDLDVGIPNARVMYGGTITTVAATPHQGTMNFGDLDGDRFYYVEFYDEGDDGGLKITKYNGTDYLSLASNDYDGTVPNGAFEWVVDYSSSAQSVSFGARHGATTFPTVTAAAAAPPLAPTTYLYFGTNHATMTFDYLAIIETL